MRRFFSLLLGLFVFFGGSLIEFNVDLNVTVNPVDNGVVITNPSVDWSTVSIKIPFMDALNGDNAFMAAEAVQAPQAAMMRSADNGSSVPIVVQDQGMLATATVVVSPAQLGQKARAAFDGNIWSLAKLYVGGLSPGS